MIEAGLIANCVLCDSYFVVIVHEFELKSYKGKKGTKQLENEIEECQVCFRVWLVPFTCSPVRLHAAAPRKGSAADALLSLLLAAHDWSDVGRAVEHEGRRNAVHAVQICRL